MKLNGDSDKRPDYEPRHIARKDPAEVWTPDKTASQNTKKADTVPAQARRVQEPASDQRTATAQKTAVRPSPHDVLKAQAGEEYGAAPKQKRPASPAEDQGEPETETPKKSRKGLTAAIIVVAVIAALFFGIGAYAASIDTIYKNVSMEGTDIGGLTAEDAANKLESGTMGDKEDETLTVTLPGDVELSVSAAKAGCYRSAPDAAQYAYDLCHGGNFFSNTITYFRSVFGGIKLKAGSGMTIDESYLKTTVDTAADKAQEALMSGNVTIGDDYISVVKGATAATIDKDKLYTTVETALKDGDFTPITFAADVDSTKVQEIDLQELYDTIYQDPKDAVYDPATQQATESVTGRSFDIDAAQKLWDAAQDGETVKIPLILQEPEVTTEALNKLLFADVLAQKSTSLGGSSSARINNITKAAAAINGIVLNPGDEFSYNSTLGQRTAAAGYQSAGAYSGGQVVSEIGGGICQVSSTLYYCALLSNLDITSRTCHYFGVNYLPAGLDATVSWPSPDFKFKNDTKYPIKIQAWVSGGAVTVKLLGSNPDGIKVVMTSAPMTVSDGTGVITYRNVYDASGNLISSKQEAKSTYHAHPTASASPSASETPAASEAPETSSEPAADAD